MATQIGNNTKEPLDETLSIGNTTANGQQIVAENGGGLIDLRFSGTDGLVVLTNDPTGIHGAIVLNKSSNAIQISQGDGVTPGLYYTEVTEDSCAFRHSSADSYSSLDPASIQHQNTSNHFISTVHAIAVFNASVLDRTSNGGDIAVIINSGNNPSVSTYKAGVERSVIIGGNGIECNTDDTMYCNQMSMQFPGNVFNTFLRPSLATSDQTQSFQDDSGSIALLKNIAISQFAVNLDSA